MSKKSRKIDKAEQNVANVESALIRTESFIEVHQNKIYIVIVAILVVIGGLFAFNKFVQEPNERDAQSAIFMAERYWEQDSIELALNGDGINLGFLDILDEYGNTKNGNLAQYYTGSCYLKLGQFDLAIDYLEDFKIKDPTVASAAEMMIGDCYTELGDYEKAIDIYTKAAKEHNDNINSPAALEKAATLCLITENWEKALECYTSIQTEYPNSAQAYNRSSLRKNIEFVEAHIN